MIGGEYGGDNVKRDLMRVKAYSIVDRMFRNQRAIEIAVAEKRCGNRSFGARGGGSGTPHISDPTAREAIANIMPISAVELPNGYTVRDPETWLKVIHYVYSEMAEPDRTVVQMFYSGKSAIAVSIECHVYESTVYRLRSECRHMATELACQYGLVRVA